MSERKGTKALELWCKRLVKDCHQVQIDNMTTSWRNGLAFCALVHHFRPDLIDLSTLQPENIYENNQLAFTIAEKHLGIPALLDPEDMVANEIPDRLSILTYLSQFYQRLGHTVNTKTSSDNDSSISTTPLAGPQPSALNMFGKPGLDKCAACDLPVYLAQRLMVAQKLYHRRCFRCSKCSGHLNPLSFKNFVGTNFVCDSCKNEKSITKYSNNSDAQMGMLAYNDYPDTTENDVRRPSYENELSKQRSRPLSILDRINMFEKNKEEKTFIDKLDSLSLKETLNINNNKDLSILSTESTSQIEERELAPELITAQTTSNMQEHAQLCLEDGNDAPKEDLKNSYKSDIKKYSFMRTQLLSDNDCDSTKKEDVTDKSKEESKNMSDTTFKTEQEDCNATDDIRLANSINDPICCQTNEETTSLNHTTNISIPPRRKKKLIIAKELQSDKKVNESTEQYPENLNPFSDDDDEENQLETPKRISLNPFGSSDEDDIPVTKPVATNKASVVNAEQTQPARRLIKAQNPFWSDDDEPSSDENNHTKSSSMYNSSISTSTPKVRQSTPLRKKAKAPPPPPPTIKVSPALSTQDHATSMDDVASLSSVSSYNSTAHSDYKSSGKLTPMLTKKQPAPTPLDSISMLSTGSRDLQGAGSMEKGIDAAGWRTTKRPAPGLPLPERREVKLQMSSDELQVQLELLETQQLGIERQGVLIEQMIRDKCEGDEAVAAPQEEVEDLVIQLCELVNEKNDLFRKQTELMYIRRQQRLEQEQADIEHEIRVIQSRPAVNRIDADKAREEQLVSRLVEIVRLRDELVQQLDSERRREKQEDLAIAASIASKRAQRNSESNSSSIKSAEVVTSPKKSKVKDKVKKQFKKAKHSLIPKKKESPSDKKEGEESIEKEKKSRLSN